MKVGLLGFGFWGRNAARAIARVADLSVIADPHMGNNSAAISEWSSWGTHVTTDHRDALRSCDAVWIATPVPTHAALVEEALASGCHVMCEKPFVLNEQDATRLAAKAQAADVALMVGHLSLYTPEHQEILDNVGDAIEMKRWNTRASLSDSSVLWGLGPHDVATCIDKWGEPDAVEGYGTTHRAVAKLTWRDGRTASIDLDWLAMHRWRHVEMRGLVIVDSLTAEPDPKAKEPLLAEAEAFVRLCGQRDGRLTKAEEAVTVTRTLHRLHDAILRTWTR